MPVRHSGLLFMFVQDSECVILCVFGHEALLKKQTSIATRGQHGSRSEAISACLCDYIIISCFLSKQEMTGAKMEARKVLP